MEDPTLRPRPSFGREIMLKLGHVAEALWVERYQEEQGITLDTGYELDNGQGGTCHPDALHWESTTLFEVKYTATKVPLPYALQTKYYLKRLIETTGDESWTGTIVLLGRFGENPIYHACLPPNDAEWEYINRIVDLHMSETEPDGICKTRNDSEHVKWYDAMNPRTAKESICPYAGHCFPDAFELV